MHVLGKDRALSEPAAPHHESTSRRIELDVTGMTCMMCARKVEKTLNKLDGVHASVKIATKIATVEAAPTVSIDRLCQAVELAGYQATERPAATAAAAVVGGETSTVNRLRTRLTMLISSKRPRK